MVVMLVIDTLQSVFTNTRYWKEFTHKEHLLFTDTVINLREGDDRSVLHWWLRNITGNEGSVLPWSVSVVGRRKDVSKMVRLLVCFLFLEVFTIT